MLRSNFSSQGSQAVFLFSPDRTGPPEKRSPRPPGRILADLPVHPLHDRLADRQPQADTLRKGKNILSGNFAIFM